MINGKSPVADGNKTIVPEQEGEGTSTGANSQQPTPRSLSGIKLKDGDKMPMPEQDVQSTATGSKTKQAMTKTQITEENESKMEELIPLDKAGSERANKNESGDDIETKDAASYEELSQLVHGLIASGTSVKTIEESFEAWKTETKKRKGGLKLGRGRGRGRGRRMGRGT
jgi:hypothetical protein